MKYITDDTGNCYAACVASITGIPFDELKVENIPPPHDDPAEERKLARELNNRMNDLLRERGWAIAHMGTRIPNVVCIGSGRSPRGNFDHAVICEAGRIIWDPHPSRAGVEMIDDFEVLVPIIGLCKSSREVDTASADKIACPISTEKVGT